MTIKVEQWPSHSIAVIGMAGRFPGADTVDALWEHLCNGEELIHRFSDGELQESGIPTHLLSDPDYVKARGILDSVESFDAGFFGLNPQQARVLDPQQRLWLECVHDALDDAGQTSLVSDKAVGVFAGARESTYILSN